MTFDYEALLKKEQQKIEAAKPILRELNLEELRFRFLPTADAHHES